MRFYIVDAFTQTLFGGNPAGVVILAEGADFPKEELMIKVAAELRYSETAFVKKMGENRFQTRYFTPTAEVELCGHATIATFHVLQQEGLVVPNQSYTNETLAGDLNIDIKEGRIFMEMGEAKDLGVLSQEEQEELYRIMGITGGYQAIEQKGSMGWLEPRKISTGLPDIIMPVASEEALAQINPDMPALSAFSDKLSVVGVHAFTAGQSANTFHCRNFAPLFGIDEEAATGTANGALTYYLFKQGLAAQQEELLFVQGEKMERPSNIVSILQEVPGKIQICVGGSAVILAEGSLAI